MTNSKSTLKWLVVVVALVFWFGIAQAERKRVVVLEFEGPNADKFRSEVIKLIKKKHAVLKTDKWNKYAEELDAAKVTEKNVKKVAKKMKVDGVVTGKVDKKRDEYVIKLKLRSGATGELVGSTVTAKADGPRLEDQAEKEVKDELVAAIDELESNSGGGEDGEDKKDDDGDKKSGFGKKDDDETNAKRNKKDDEDKKDDKKDSKKESKVEEPPPDEAAEEDKSKKRKNDDNEDADSDEDGGSRRKRKASKDDDDGESDSVSEGADISDTKRELNLSVGRRAIDATVGLSFTRRNLTFIHASDLGDPPPGYKQGIPVAGALLDMTFYPMSFSHKRKDVVTGIGLNILYDKILLINSQKRYSDVMNNPQTADLDTKENRWQVGGVFRYPLGKKANSLVIGGSLSFGKQVFSVAQTLPNGQPTDIPNVSYTMISPAAFVRLPLLPKITFNVDAAFHAITNTGAIQERDQYGAATVSGYDLEFGGDYMIMPNIFARASIRYQSIGFTFKGDPMAQSNTRDTDPEQDVTGAKDTYFGGTATIGYTY